MTPWDIGTQYGKSFASGMERSNEANTIEDILRRSQENTVTVQDLMPLLFKVKDPQKRQMIQQQLQNKESIRYGQEINGILDKYKNLSGVENMNLAVRDIMSSNIPVSEKKKAIELIQSQTKFNEDLAFKSDKKEKEARSNASAAQIFKQLERGEINLDEADALIFEGVEDAAVAAKAQAQLRAQRMDLRANNRLEKTDPEVKENVKIINGLAEDERKAKTVLNGINSQRSLISKGNTGSLKDWIGKQFPAVRRFIENPDSTELRTLALNDMIGATSLIKNVRLTDYKLKFIMDTVLDPGATPEQQLRALEGLEDIFRQKIYYAESLRNIEKANPGKSLKYIPNLSLRVNELVGDVSDEADDPSLQEPQALQESKITYEQAKAALEARRRLK